jgi:hypothetical protein
VSGVPLARILFSASGALWLVIGLLTPFASETSIGTRTLMTSPATDTDLFGAAPEKLLASDLRLSTLRRVMLRAIAGLLVAGGLLTTATAWYGLRRPTIWALTLLTAVTVLVLPYWWISFGPYREAGIRLRLLDLPPFMWVPGILMPLASVLGWLDVTGAT